MKDLAYLKNNRGLTLIELMVTITIAIVVLAPIYEVLLTGNKVQIKSFGQVDLQEKTQLVLNQLVEGKISGGTRVGGLREAGQAQVVVEPDKGVAFVSDGKLVTYYFENQKIYYKDQNYVTEPEPEPILLNDISSTGTPILENVQSFNVTEDDVNNKLYQIKIQTSKNLSGGGKNEITLVTKVRPRN